MSPPPQDITKLLLAWRNGDKQALDRLMPLVYEELRRMADRYMRNERKGHTLQTSALVNEAYLRLVDHENIAWHEGMFHGNILYTNPGKHCINGEIKDQCKDQSFK